jgi:type I restriction enzyme M protein
MCIRMNIKDELEALLVAIGFNKANNSRWLKSYTTHNNYELIIDFSKEKIDYGSAITVGDLTTNNFSKPENLVVLECVDRLLVKGYKPQSLTLEKRWTLGRSAKSGKADITVATLDNKTLFIVECKTWGTEYGKEKVRMQRNGGQLFSYLRQDRNCQYLCLYTSKVDSSVVYENAIVRVVDDKKLIEQFEKGNSDIKLFRDAKSNGPEKKDTGLGARAALNYSKQKEQ